MPETATAPGADFGLDLFGDLPEAKSSLPSAEDLFGDIPEAKSKLGSAEDLFGDLPNVKSGPGPVTGPVSSRWSQDIAGPSTAISTSDWLKKPLVKEIPMHTTPGRNMPEAVLHAADDVVAGIANYFQTPQGIGEVTLAGIPTTAPIIFGKWASDMYHGAKESIENIGLKLNNLLAETMHGRGVTGPQADQLRQDIVNNAINVGVMGLGAAGAGVHAVKGAGAVLKPVVTEALKATAPMTAAALIRQGNLGVPESALKLDIEQQVALGQRPVSTEAPPTEYINVDGVLMPRITPAPEIPATTTAITEQAKGQPNAVYQQSSGQEVLRPEGAGTSEGVELPQVGTRNPESEVPAQVQQAAQAPEVVPEPALGSATVPEPAAEVVPEPAPEPKPEGATTAPEVAPEVVAVKSETYPERPEGETESGFMQRLAGRQAYELTLTDWQRFNSYEYLAGGERRARQLQNKLGSEKERTDFHRAAVEQALRDGKPVPEAVLADYPDLKPKVESAAEPAPVTASAIAKMIPAEFAAYDKSLGANRPAVRAELGKAETEQTLTRHAAEADAEAARLLREAKDTNDPAKMAEALAQAGKGQFFREAITEAKAAAEPKVEPGAVAKTDPRLMSDSEIAAEIGKNQASAAPHHEALQAIPEDELLKKNGSYTPKAQAIADQIKPFSERNQLLQFEAKRRADEITNKKMFEARDKRVAEAPVYQRRNGWEIIKDGVDYVLRHPETKEDIYRGKLKRVREVADESIPEPTVPKPESAPEPAPAEAKAPEVAAPKLEPKSGLESWLDDAIEKTKPGTGWTGSASMGLAKVPVWLAQEALHGSLLVIREAVRAGKTIAAGIDSAIEHIKSKNLEGFDEAEARNYFTAVLPKEGPKPAPEPVKPIAEPSSGSETSNKNAVVDKERVDRGLEPMMAAIRQGEGKVWADAMAKIDADPTWQDRLIGELETKPRALTGEENAALLQRRVVLRNEFDKVAQDAVTAFDKGDTAAVNDANARTAIFSDMLTRLEKATKSAGSESGRSLAYRKMMMNEDFTLAKLEMEKRAARGGAPITADERAELKKIAAEHKAKVDELEKHLAERDTKLAVLESEAAHRKLLEETAKSTAANAKVKTLTQRIVDALESEANDSRKYLAGKTFTLSPDVLYHLGKIGALEIARGTIELGAWSAKMVAEFGEKIKPHLDEVFAKANELLDLKIAKGPEPKKVKAAIREAPKAQAEIDTITDQIKAKVMEDAGDDIGYLAQKLAKQFVAAGIRDRELLIDAVHNVLKDLVPDHSRRDTMDAISGYGKYKQLSKDEISVALRQAKGEMQQVAKLQDMQSGQAPKKTGVERREPSDAERALIKQVNEAKKKGGFTVTDPATQLRSALQSAKTAVRNQIVDLETEIRTRERIVKQKNLPPTDPELESLRKQRDELRVVHDEIFGKREMTDEARVAAANRALDKSIAELERQIKERDVLPKAKQPSKTPITPELEAKRARLEALREQKQELLDIINPKKTPDEIANQSYKTRLARELAMYQEKIAAGDFTVKPKKPERVYDPETNKLRADVQMIRNKFYEDIARERYKNRTTFQQLRDIAVRGLSTPRALKSSFDFSAVLRQGGFVVLGHPIRGLKSMGDMFKSFASERAALAADAEIHNRPNAPLYNRSKLYLAPLESFIRSSHEEAFLPSWAEKIPGVRPSERSYITFLNKLRADSFDAMVTSLEKRGQKLAQPELNAIANYINVATGRGNLGKHAAAAESAANIFFSPRLVASRFQLLAGQPLYKGTGRTRRLVAEEYARTLMGLSAIYALATTAGATVETDSNSSDFGKLKFGNTRIDPMMGLSQNTVMLSRLLSGKTKTITGKERPIRGPKVPYGGTSGADILANFARTKLAPVPGAAVDIVTGKNVVGEPVTPGSVTAGLFSPMTLGMKDLSLDPTQFEVYNIMKEQGIPAGVAIEMLNILGMGVQNFESRRRK